jgi:hypothetical protein
MNRKNNNSNAAGWVTLDSCLRPLVRRLERYDFVREKLEKEGGQAADIGMIIKLLDEPLAMQYGPADRFTVKLTEHESLRRRLSRIADHDICFDVRALPTGMPAYYICRTRSDFWTNYTFIVEDIYRSPGYPSFDDRFCRLMVLGRETHFLRLSQLRGGVHRMTGRPTPPDRDEVDGVLHRMGRRVLQRAWHEDQLSGVLTARHFELVRFRNAIELLYLCLSSDLCELRSSIDQEMLEFFDTVYPQPAIKAFLETLKGLRGSDLNDIGRRALACYALLSKEYGKFLSTSVTWAGERPSQPLFKLVFANFYRLESLEGLAEVNPGLLEASARLESSAGCAISDLVGRDISLSAA